MANSEGVGTRFVVQWEEHPSHLASRLGQLLEQQTLVDVTLMCNTHTLRVHRSVLAACSPYFENLLQNISQRQLVQHPLIVLKDMQFTVLKCMIEFMYCGETNVTEDDLGPLLQAAKFFQVKGLSSMTKEALGLPSRPAATPANKGKVNGEVGKPMNKPATPMAAKSTLGTPKSMVVSMPVQQKQAVKTTTTTTSSPALSAVRESPGLSAASSDTAELLLSLSGDAKEGQQGKVLTQVKVGTGTTASKQPQQIQLIQTQRPIQVGSGSSGVRAVGAAVDSTFQLAPNQPEGSSPIYQPGPRKRGRPLKRQMDLMFQEKVISDTDMALRKEAEASRKALQSLQKELSSEGEATTSSASSSSPMTTSRVVKTITTSQLQSGMQGGLVMKSKLVPIPSAATKVTASGLQTVTSPKKVQAATTASATTPATSTVTAGTSSSSSSSTTVSETAGSSTVTYQLSEGGSGNPTVMSQYMEVLKEAGLPTDVPILLDSGDGNYVTVNEEILMNIVNGGGLQYQVTEELQEVNKEATTTETPTETTEGQVLTLEGGSGDDLQQQVVRYVDDNGEIVEGVLAVVQEGEEGTTVAVTPTGQVLQIQASADGESYQIVESAGDAATTQGNTSAGEGLITGDLDTPSDGAGVKRDGGPTTGDSAAKKRKTTET